MKGSDRTIIVALVVLGAFAAFWFLALSPKRDEASKLGDKVEQLQSDISAKEQLAAAGVEAQAGYQSNYSSLVALGKAAPADGDTPSLVEQLVTISDRAKTSFDLLELGTAPAEETPPPPAETTSEDSEEASEPPAGESTTVAAPAPATEASASSLPIGASVGSAGLGRLAYEMSFSGDFFQIADLFAGMDDLIGSKQLSVDVGGRLITINGFTMTKEAVDSPLSVDLSISSYVLPESQGLTAGGTSTMPPNAVPAAAPVQTP